MKPVSLIVNDRPVQAEIEDRTLLSTFLREHLLLTGTHIGCDTTQCGCCTVLMDGDAVKSCTVLLVQAAGSRITTIEGLGTDDAMHPLQQAFIEHHALQCGYCTPGFILSALDLIEKYDDLDEEKVRHLVDGNMCRCTGYENIVKAILAAAHSISRAEVQAEPAQRRGKHVRV